MIKWIKTDRNALPCKTSVFQSRYETEMMKGNGTDGKSFLWNFCVPVEVFNDETIWNRWKSFREIFMSQSRSKWWNDIQLNRNMFQSRYEMMKWTGADRNAFPYGTSVPYGKVEVWNWNDEMKWAAGNSFWCNTVCLPVKVWDDAIRRSRWPRRSRRWPPDRCRRRVRSGGQCYGPPSTEWIHRRRRERSHRTRP